MVDSGWKAVALVLAAILLVVILLNNVPAFGRWFTGDGEPTCYTGVAANC